MYKVYDTGKPACLPHPAWGNNSFESLQEASDYVRDWLDFYATDEIKYTNLLEVGKKYYYYSDTEYMEIKKEDN